MNTRHVPSMMGVAAALFAATMSVACVARSDDSLVIYAYDSFASEWGPAPIVIPAFEKAAGVKVELVVPGDAGQVLARAIDEKSRPVADILIGVDNNLLPKAIAAGVLQVYRPAAAEKVPAELVLDPSWHVTP